MGGEVLRGRDLLIFTSTSGGIRKGKKMMEKQSHYFSSPTLNHKHFPLKQEFLLHREGRENLFKCEIFGCGKKTRRKKFAQCAAGK
jgi:hypothetical protein